MEAIILSKPKMLGLRMFVYHPKTAWGVKMFPLETRTPYASFASLLFIYTRTGLNFIHCTVVIKPTLVLYSLWLGGRQLDKFAVQTSSKLQSFNAGMNWSVIDDYKLYQSRINKSCNWYCEYWAVQHLLKQYNLILFHDCILIHTLQMGTSGFFIV